MLREPLKRSLIRIAHSGMGGRIRLHTRLEQPITILGRKIYPNTSMSPSFPWLHKFKGEILHDELMSAHTSIRIGGPADIFFKPKNLQDLQTILKNRGDTSLFIIGEGTNLLVRDKGFRGMVVSLKDCFKSIQRPLFFRRKGGQEAAVVRVGAGVKMSFLAKHVARYSLTGVEPLVGIPGSLGGSLVMNAGAEGTEIGQVVRSITCLTANGDLQTIKRDELTFQYRKTLFPWNDGIITEAELEFEKGDMADIHEAMSSHLSRRSSKQPLTIPNSGSIFKNPPGHSAGQLIESAGLKGFSINDAGVSLKHANFIVNKREARATDVIRLIEHIQDVVKEKTGIELETEIIIAGE